ncbi:hypothetical protein ACILE9_01080 [Capnocytophaga cynodegmi]|uniref:hypothetical protein n=1 Tax=Capnocytophaga cynodegmi TaxID=28189 RepID=UPI0037D88796
MEDAKQKNRVVLHARITPYAYDMLTRKNDPDNAKSLMKYQYLSEAELDYKPLEGETEGISLEQIRKAFCFGSVDGGVVFFTLKTTAFGRFITICTYAKRRKILNNSSNKPKCSELGN